MPDSVREFVEQLSYSEAYELYLWLCQDDAVFQILDLLEPIARQSDNFKA
jgi:hypothetical protein